MSEDGWRWCEWTSIHALQVTGDAWLIGGEWGVFADPSQLTVPRLLLSCLRQPFVLAQMQVLDMRVWETFIGLSEHAAGVLLPPIGVQRLPEDCLRPPRIRAMDQPFLDALAHDLPGGCVLSIFEAGVVQCVHLPGLDRGSVESTVFVCDLRGRGLQPDVEWFTFDPNGQACWLLDSVEDWLSDRLIKLPGSQFSVRSSANDEFVRNWAYYEQHGSAWKALKDKGAL